MALTPLKRSWAEGSLEADLRDLFISIFEDLLREQADEINVYGAPHLGSSALIARHIDADQLAILRSDDHRMRYLFKAWKHRNPERGLHFLRTYLQVLFGATHQVSQLWQKKSDPYPTNLVPDFASPSESTHFLTSRVRVDLDIADAVPDRIVKALRTTMAARFVLSLRIAKFSTSEVGMANVTRGMCIVQATSEAVAPPNMTAGIGSMISGVANVLYTISE